MSEWNSWFFRYYRCAFKRTLGCPATGVLIDGVFVLNDKNPHNHPAREDYEEDQEFRDRLSAAMCTPGVENIKDTYDAIKAEWVFIWL